MQKFKNYVSEVCYQTGLGLSEDEQRGIVDRTVYYFSGSQKIDFSSIRRRIYEFIDVELGIVAHGRALKYSQNPDYSAVFWWDVISQDGVCDLLTDWSISRLNSEIPSQAAYTC